MGTMSQSPIGPFSWEKVVRAVEKAQERLFRATAALERAGVPYAVAAENATAEWVRQADGSAVRTAPRVDLLLRREDLAAATAALEGDGFVAHPADRGATFIDGPHGNARSAVFITWAAERVRPDDSHPSPDVTESEQRTRFRVMRLDALVTMLLTANRSLERMQLRDLIDVGLVDATWPGRLPQELAERLQTLLDTPDG
jgi:hypothetical protein